MASNLIWRNRHYFYFCGDIAFLAQPCYYGFTEGCNRLIAMKLATQNKAAPLTLDTLSQDHIAVSINWFMDMSSADKWNLTHDEVCDLLGGIPKRTLYDLRKKAESNLPVSINRDMAERLSLLLGIWKALQIIVPTSRRDLAYKWFNQPNTSLVLMGKSIKEFLIERKSIEGLYTVRRYLDAMRG
jgi:hypothetical protein